MKQVKSSPDTVVGAGNLGISADGHVGADQPGNVRAHLDSPTESGMPIAWLLPFVLTGLELAAVVPVALLGYFGARDNTDRLMRDRSELVLDVLVHRVKAHLAMQRLTRDYPTRQWHLIDSHSRRTYPRLRRSNDGWDKQINKIK